MRVVIRPPLRILRLRGEHLLPHERPHPGRHFLSDLQDLFVEVAEVLPGHCADRHPRGNALCDHRELEMCERLVESDVVKLRAGQLCVAFCEMGPCREAWVPRHSRSQYPLVLPRLAPVEEK